MNIQYYPGHMHKTTREISELIKQVDVVLEIRDARIPKASFNEMLAGISAQKPRVLILNKADQADEKITAQWIKYFQQQGYLVVALNALVDNVDKILSELIKKAGSEVLAKAKRKGLLKKVLKVCIMGVPNVGKSTIINRLVKKKTLKVANMPGVTRSLNWVRIHQDFDLLDTPGVLLPKFEDETQGYLLALMGSIKLEVLDEQALALKALSFLLANHLELLNKRYQVKLDANSDPLIAAKIIALAKGFLKNDEADLTRCFEHILSDVRLSNFGAISYERPE